MDPVLFSTVDPGLAALEERYRRLLVERFARLTFRGIARTGKAVSLPLEDVYVELKAVTDIPDAADAYSADERRVLVEAQVRGMPDGDLRRQLDSLRVERWREESRRGHARMVRRSIGDAVADPSRLGLVILGDPGSGKTTLLHYLALCEAKKHAAEPRARLPIFVPLAAYDEWLRSNPCALPLVDFLAVYYEKWRSFPGLAPLFRRALDEGRALVLIDGLDEVLAVGARRHIAEQAGALIQAEAPRGNRFVITSRIVGYREAPLPGDLPHVTVLDFGAAEIASFAHKWCEACEVWLADGSRTDAVLQQAAREEQALIGEVRANPSVLLLAANPLLLTMLALLRRQGGKLPDERVRLYQQYIDMLLDNNWEDVRSDGARTKGVDRFDRNLATSYLIELALWLQKHRPSGTARRRDLELILVEIALKADGLDPVQATEKARRIAQDKAALFLQEMRHFAGLLAERGHDAFGFLHLTFQEYFAGRALARMDDAEARWAVIKEHLHRPRWREPLLLCAGQLGIVEGRIKAVSDLGRRILGAASKHEEMLHRDVFLAAAMAVDGVGVDPGLLDEVARRLLELATDTVPAVRLEALRGVAKLARLGHEGARRSLEERVRLKTEPQETAKALEGVLGADFAVGLRRSLCDWLDDHGYEVRTSAIDALKPVVTSDREVRRLTLDKLNAPNMVVCQAAVKVLGALVATDGDIRRLILDKLNDANKDMRQVAVESLGALAPNDDTIRDLILDRLHDSDDGVRTMAIEALRALATSDEKVRDIVIERLNDPHVWVRDHAVGALGSLVASNDKVRRLIIKKLADSSGLVRSTAVGELEVLVVSDEKLRGLILDKLHDSEAIVRYAAIGALKSLISTDAEVRRLILDGLGHQAWCTVSDMIEALGALLVQDAEVHNIILDKLSDTHEGVRRAAVRALAGLVTNNEKVQRLFLERLGDPDEGVRQAVIRALAVLVTNNESTRNLILRKLDDTGARVRWAAVSALAALVPNDEKISRLIFKRLDDVDDAVRGAAVGALGPLAASNKKVRSLILKRLDDTGEWVRQATIRALGPLVARDKKVRGFVVGKLDDTDRTVRAAAIGVLETVVASDQKIRERIFAQLNTADYWLCAAAVNALSALALNDQEARGLLLQKLDDETFTARLAVVRALGGLVTSDNVVRARILAKLDDSGSTMRQAAVRAMEVLTMNDESLRRQIADKLDDPDFGVRDAAVCAMATHLGSDPGLQQRLLCWLGVVHEYDDTHAARTRRRLADAYGPLLAEKPELLARVRTMLCSPAWPERVGAAWALLAMPGGPPPDVWPTLRGLFEDLRAEESWPERLQVAGMLINDQDASLSRRAIDVTLEAFDYATRTWYNLPNQGGGIRAQAAQILGTLDPVYWSEAIFSRLTRVVHEDANPYARDAAYQALLRLSVAPEAEHDIEALRVSASTAQPSPETSPNPEPTMLSLLPSVVLHLSDLHFGTVENATTWSSQLAEDLTRELHCTKIDAVILSGDIANLSTPDEYKAARLFLDKLAKDFHLTPQQIIPVPGNHDLDWGLARKAYVLHERAEYTKKLEEGSFIPHGSEVVGIRQEKPYEKRFNHFAKFYQAIRGERYPLQYDQQGLLYHLPAQNLLILGLNSAWNLDHHFKSRAAIHPGAVASALDRIRKEPAYNDCLKIAVWHHPVDSAFEDRIIDHGFLEQLANAGFRLGLHGHIHKARNGLYRYDVSPAGRRLELLCAGTFGAPIKEWTPGYPLQYQLLRLGGDTLTVETRRREEINGAWKPDARWVTEPGKDPEPRYRISL